MWLSGSHRMQTGRQGPQSSGLAGQVMLIRKWPLEGRRRRRRHVVLCGSLLAPRVTCPGLQCSSALEGQGKE